MRLSFRRLFFIPSVLCLGLILAACTPAAPSAIPVVLTMNYTPALRPFGPVFQTCTRMQPGLSLLVNELAIGQIDTLPADIILTWSDAKIAGRTPYQTGSEELVFIVNHTNPVTSVSAEQLEALLSGQTLQGADVLDPSYPDCTGDSCESPIGENPVQIWTYPSGDEVLRAVTDIPGGSQIPPFQARLAPDPEAMRQAVSQNQNALGFIPRRWLDASVKMLEVRGLPAGAGQQAILAYPSEPLSPQSSAFIACLQQVLNP